MGWLIIVTGLPALARQAHAGTLQIICRASTEVVYQRFQQRAEAGLRHPGHLDLQIMGLPKVSLDDRPVRLDIGGEVIEVDTTDFSALDYQAILAQVKAMMSDACLDNPQVNTHRLPGDESPG